MNIESHYRLHFTPVVTALCRHYPGVSMDDLLDAVQEAFETAIRYEGSIMQPGAWLYRVAENKLLTELRRKSKSVYLPADDDLPEEDRTYALLCFFSTLESSERNRLVLGLYFIGGLSTKQIAEAVRTSSENVKKILQRSRQMLRLSYPHFRPQALHEPSARNFLYLLFNEGYKRSAGAEGISHDLCFEALRLTQQLPASPDTAALLALMCYHASRFPARVRDGAFVPLYAQDRSTWNRTLIRQGHTYLEKARPSTHVFFLEALVSAQHCLAEDFESTPWQRIAMLYGKMRPYTAEIQLNHLIARCHYEDPSSLLEELLSLPITFSRELAEAYFHERRNDKAAAREKYRSALERAENPCDTVFLQKKLEKLQVELDQG